MAVGLLALLAGSLPARAAGPLTTRAYDRVLQQVEEGLARAAGQGKGSAAAAKRALGALPEQVEVQDAGQAAPVKVDNRGLREALQDMAEGGPEGIAQARAALDNLRQAVSRPRPAAPAAARSTLAKVLARGEFRLSWREKRTQEFWEWADRVARRLTERVHLPRWDFGRLGGVWRPVGIGLLVGCGTAMLLLIARLLLRRQRPVAPQASEPEARPTVLLPSRVWLEEAERSARAGDYRLALRAVHMAALMRLDDAGLVAYHHAYTDGRFVRALQSRGQAEVARTLAQLNRLFARAWYGRAPSGAEEYRAAQQLWEELEGGVRVVSAQVAGGPVS